MTIAHAQSRALIPRYTEDVWRSEFLAGRPTEGSEYRTQQGSRVRVSLREDGPWLEGAARSAPACELIALLGPVGRGVPELATPPGMESRLRDQLVRLAERHVTADPALAADPALIASLARRIAPVLGMRYDRDVLAILRRLLDADDREERLTTLIPTNPSTPRKATSRADVAAPEGAAA